MPHSIGSNLFKTWLTIYVHLTVFWFFVCSNPTCTKLYCSNIFWNKTILKLVSRVCTLFFVLFWFVCCYFFVGVGEFARLIWLDRPFPSCTFASVRLCAKPFIWNCVRLEVSNWLSYERFCLMTRFKTQVTRNWPIANNLRSDWIAHQWPNQVNGWSMFNVNDEHRYSNIFMR